MREMKRNGKSFAKIAREINVDRKTVSKYLNGNTPPSYKKREVSTRIDPIDGHEDRLNSLLAVDGILAVDIYEKLVEEGYKGSERTIRRRVAGVNSQKEKERFFEQLYIPGEQAQFDFKEKIEIPFYSGNKAIYLHFGTLPYSDHFFIRAYPSKNFECFMEGIHFFFDDLGGMTQEIRIDNLSPCVAKVHNGSRRTYTESFQRAIDYYGFKVSPCRPAKGSDKGDVERDIRTHAGRIKRLINIDGLKFENFDVFNNWLIDYRNKRITDATMAKRAEEIGRLDPLPNHEESILYRIESIVATSYGAIKLGDYYYSVPDVAIGIKCYVVATPFEVKIYRTNGKKELLANHSRESGDSIKLEHILPSLVRKPAAMVRWKDRDVLFPNTIFKKFYSMLKMQEKEVQPYLVLKKITF